MLSADLELEALSEQADGQQYSHQCRGVPFLRARDPCARGEGARQQQALARPKQTACERRGEHLFASAVLNGRFRVVLKVPPRCGPKGPWPAAGRLRWPRARRAWVRPRE